MLSGLIIYSPIDKEKNVWFIDKCRDSFAEKGISLLYKDESESLEYIDNNNIDFIIYRGRDYQLVEQFESRNIKCFNNSLANKIANDKYLTYQFLLKQNVSCIPSFLSYEEVDSESVIMKSVNGHGGNEVFLVRSKEEADAICNKLQKKMIYQKFYKNQGDLRLYLLNKKVVGAVIRNSDKDFRSNFSLGGSVKPYEPDKEVVAIAERIAQLLNADYIGVDFLKVNNKWMVNEIEDPVGARMLYKTSNIDIISLYVNYIFSLTYFSKKPPLL